jgi:phage tail-like protein
MRGLLSPPAEVPVSIGELLPGVYQEDEFAMRWCAGLDGVLAPVFATLDCLDCYIDPLLAPADFLEWLSGWVGMALDERWPVARRRAVVAHAVELFRARGTVAGLIQHVELATAGRVSVADSGGVAVSVVPGGELPGETVPRMAVRVAVEDPSAVDEQALDILVRAAKPAHVIHRVEVVAE